MEYEEYFDARDTGSRSGIPRIFVGSPYQHGIESFLGGLFRKILSYLNKGARAVSKEALRAGINIIEDVENNKSLKKVVKNQLAESWDNLKEKAKEKINFLMKGYKISAKSAALQFPFEIDVSCNVNDTGRSKENHREILQRRRAKK